MTSFTVRPEQCGDEDSIEAVTHAAFEEAEHRSGTEALIVSELRAAAALTLSLVAEHKRAVVGHVAVSPIHIDGSLANWFGLGPISVVPAWQRKSVGTSLMNAALKALRERGAGGCVLLGDPRYYARFGFKNEPALVLPDVPPAYFQALCLRGDVPTGVVTYHAAFSAVPASA